MNHYFNNFADSVIVEELDELPEEFREFQPTEPLPLSKLPDQSEDFWANSEFADNL